MIPPTVVWIAAAALAMGASGGYWLADWLADGRVSEAEARRIQCEHARERDARAAAEKTADLLKLSGAGEAQSARQLAAATAAAERKHKETRNDLYALTSGRECLSGPLRLRLNAALAADGLPPGAAAAAPTAAAAAADTSVALWITDVAWRYDECRARLDAIRKWDEVTHGR